MRKMIVLGLLAIGVAGCHKERILSNFHFKPGMTMEDVEDDMGSPTIEAPHWIAYKMKDGSQLRIYFLERQPDGKRTITAAALFAGEGQDSTQVNVFRVHPLKPAGTQPGSTAAHPATAPSAH